MQKQCLKNQVTYSRRMKMESSSRLKKPNHHLTVRKIIQKWKTFEKIADLSQNGWSSKITSRSDIAVFRETAKKKKGVGVRAR